MSKPTGWSSSLWKVRERAVQLVAEERGPDAVDLLIEALDDISWRVQMAAVLARGGFAEPRTSQPLLKACFADNEEVARSALDVLGFPALPDEMLSARLAHLHGSDSPRTRAAVEHYALTTGRPEALMVLTSVVKSKEQEMKALACKRIPVLAEQRSADMSDRREAANALLAMAASGEREDRLNALRALRRMAKWISVPDLAPLCSDADSGVAREAVEVVGLVGGVPARDLVRQLLHSEVPGVRLGAVNALLSFDRPAYAGALRDAAKDPSDLVRFGIAEGLSAGAPPEACAAIASLLSDSSQIVRLAAVAALARSSNATSLGLLAECAASTSPETSASAAEFVRGLGGPEALAEIILQTPSPSPYERARAFLRLHGLQGFDSHRYLRAAATPFAGPHHLVARETMEAIADMGSLLRPASGADVSAQEGKELLRSAGPGASEREQLLRAPLPEWVRSDEELLTDATTHPEGAGGWVSRLFGGEEEGEEK